MNKVEAVARALAQHVGPYAFDDCPADKAALKAGEWSTNDFTQSDLLEMARAAIEAMKGPTAAMIRSIVPEKDRADYDITVTTLVVQHDTMLQAALDE